MSSWFSSRPKFDKLVAKASEALRSLRNPSLPKEERAKAMERIKKSFGTMAEVLYKKKEGDEAKAQLVNEICHSEFLMDGLEVFLPLPVEQRKEFTIIFTGAIAHQTGSVSPVAIWVQRNPKTIDILIGFYDHPELAVCAGDMLRLCIKYEFLAKLFEVPERLDKLFSYFTVQHFDVSADSFATFREWVLHGPQMENYLRGHKDSLIKRLNGTLDEKNYAACRQSLRLIGEMIAAYPEFQDAYLTDEKNLMLMMDLMVSSYKNISMDAFHVFKMFVARENKPEPIASILGANAQKLITFIDNLLNGIEDPELQKEREFLELQLGYLMTEKPE